MKSPTKASNSSTPKTPNSGVKKATSESKKPRAIPANSPILATVRANLKDSDFFKKLPKEGPFSFMVKPRAKVEPQAPTEPDNQPSLVDEANYKPPMTFDKSKEIHPKGQNISYPRRAPIAFNPPKNKI